MATAFNFNGRLIKLPGAYSQITSGINNAPLNLSYGNILVIDTDDTNEYGGGSGIDGQNQNAKDAIYQFNNIRDFRRFIAGGELWDNAKPLFRPFGSGSQGVSNLFYIRALTTTPGSVTLTVTNGELIFKTKHEGLCANGVEVDNKLIKGFAVTLSAGIFDNSKFVLKFWRGTYAGNDQNGLDYSLNQQDSEPVMVAQSPEVSNIQQIIDWASNNFDFNNNFILSDSTITTTGEFDSADLSSFSGNQLFIGATQTSNAQSLDNVLDVIAELDYTHVYSLESGSDATGVNNMKILSHIENEARYDKFIVIAGGENKNEYQSVSITAAQTLNSTRALVVHGGCFENDLKVGNGLRQKNAKYKVAYVLGRAAGLEPQTPVTFKGLGYAGEVHKMTKSEREQGLDHGVITTYFDEEVGFNVITQGINTLQNNDFLVNDDGSSYSWQLMRIAAQLNKELIVNAKKQLLANQSQGPNRSTLSPAVVVEWVKSYLKRKTAKSTEDNLIISFKEVTVTVNQDAYNITYGFQPNFEVNKLFFTGLILDPNLN